MSIVLDLIGREEKVHLRYSYKEVKHHTPNLIYKRFEFFELSFGEYKSLKPHKVVGLRTSTIKKIVLFQLLLIYL